ncbi:Myb-like_protein [Hexamita inflata]|uniref:Myb-like protein n=1 Tax=Hexamita inflata TaxID=28002 RepID=A0AA86TDX8_9EUKA|nr:Myb-like protein [Hexamita inflata]CAI9945383.1 Myb-like protein [Hexamita inflata]CAI9964001.1 Myb-like protein [Hexamita inflata]
MDTSISVTYEPFDSLLSSSQQDQQLASDLIAKLNQLNQVQNDIDARLQKLQNTKWSAAENNQFLKALQTVQFSDTAGIQKIVQTKSFKQVGVYLQKYVLKLEKAYNQEMSDEQVTELVPAVVKYLTQADAQCVLATVKLLKKYTLSHRTDDPEQICETKKCIFTSYIESEIKQAEEITKKFVPVVLAAENVNVAAIWLGQKYNLLPEQIMTATLAIYLNKQGFRLDSGQHGLELIQTDKKTK